jgi:hypothetical protein
VKTPFRHRFLRLFIGVLLMTGNLSVPTRRAFAAQGTPVDINLTVTVLPETPPDAISDLTAIPGTDEGTIRLDWTSPGDDGLTGDLNGFFRIRVSTDPVPSFSIPPDVAEVNIATSAATGSAQTYLVNGLEPGATYHFAMLAEDDAYVTSGQRSSWSTVGVNAANSAAAPDLAPPAPANPAAAAGDSQVTVSWDAVPAADLDFYRVYADTTAPVDFADQFVLVDVDSGTLSHLHAGLTNDTTYAYRVTAVDKGAPSFVGVALESAYSAAVTAFPNAAPSAISDLTALAGAAEGEIRLTWTAPGADGAVGTASAYVLKYSTFQITAAGFAAASAYAQSWTPLASGSAEEQLVNGLTPQTTYFFALRAQDAQGQSGVWNSVSDDPLVNTLNSAAALEIAPSAITDLQAFTGPSTGTVVLTWTSPGDDGLTGALTGGRFRIDYATEATAGHLTDPASYLVDLATGAAPGEAQTVTVGGLAAGQTQHFRVYALDDRGNASVSNAASAEAFLGFFADSTPPEIVSFTPSSAWADVIPSDVAPDAVVTVTFSEEMLAATVAGAVRLRAVLDNMGRALDAPVSGAVTHSGAAATFRPAAPLEHNHTYELEVTTDAKDLSGNALAQPLRARFRTLFDRTVENVFYAADGRTFVRFPPGTLPADGFMRISLDPMRVSFAALSGTIDDANAKQIARGGRAFAPLADTLREFQLVSAADGSDLGAQLKGPAELNMPFDDPDGDGFVEYDGGRIHRRFLGIVNLNERAGLWVVTPGSEVDVERKVVTVKVPHFSVYAVMPVATNFVGDAFAYPVPFVPSQGHSAVTFTNLALDTMIRIYTVSGDLVREIHETDGDGQADWDAKNGSGDDAASGVYIYVIKSGAEKKVGKLVVIR